MKKLSVVLSIVLIAMLSGLKADTYGKQNYAGVNPFGLLFHIYSGEYGRFLDAEGSSEVNIPISFFKWGDYSYFAMGAKYRMYKNKNGEGIFYGGGLRFSRYSWNYNNSAYFDPYAGTIVAGDSGDNSWMTFTPIGEAGFRWSWSNGWTVAPSLELGYDISTNDNDKYNVTYGDGGLYWGLNLGVCYMFELLGSKDVVLR